MPEGGRIKAGRLNEARVPNPRELPMVIAATSEKTQKILRALGVAATISEAGRPLPPYPTQALPGSAAKIDVMIWRREHGFHLHHPADAKFADDPRIVLRQMVRDFDNRPIHPNDPPPDMRTLVQKAIDGAVDEAGWELTPVEV